MLRFILNGLLILLALRFVSLIVRAITAGKRPGPRLEDEPRARERGARDSRASERQAHGRRSRPRIERSDAVDVPFTEIPPDSPP